MEAGRPFDLVAEEEQCESALRALGLDAHIISPTTAVSRAYCLTIASDKFGPTSALSGPVATISHGSMFGNSDFPMQRYEHADFILGLSNYEKSYIQRHKPEWLNTKQFIAVGNPKLDYWHGKRDWESQERSNLRVRMRKHYGLHPGQRVIVISSHWGSQGNLRRYWSGLIDWVCAFTTDCTVMVTLHPKLMTQFDVSRSRHGETVAIRRHNSSRMMAMLNDRQAKGAIQLWLSRPISDLLAIADVVIGDRSSLLVEAACADVPILLSRQVEFADTEVAHHVESAVGIFEDFDELLVQLSDAFDDPGAKKMARRQFTDLFTHTIGMASQNVLNFINRF